jgi:hypothetical protein
MKKRRLDVLKDDDRNPHRKYNMYWSDDMALRRSRQPLTEDDLEELAEPPVEEELNFD